MKTINFLKTHKLGLLSAMLVLAAVALGADPGFAMAAVDAVSGTEVTPAPDPNPSSNMDPVGPNNPGGRPQGEALQPDEQGGKTQLQGKAATATDVRDAGLEAEDYDKDVDNFRKFAFPAETYFARQCRPVKCKSPEHGHYRSGSTDLTAVYIGDQIQITPGTSISGTFNKDTYVLTIDVSNFDNPECLLEYSTVTVRNVSGYKKADDGSTQIPDGELVLFVLDHKDGDEKVKFKIMNPSTVAATKMTIPANAKFYVMATAGSESQMHVASETWLPEKFIVFLQKKIVTCVVTDAFEDQDKKISHKTKDILANAEYNFKRKCARSHWNGTKGKIQISVPETGGREDVYFENGVLRQISMLYTFSGDDMTDDDLLALTTLMFTNNSMSDEATAFCGKKAMKRLIRLVNSADKYKDVGKVEVNDYGIKVRKYRDNFGTIEFVWDPTLDDLGYEDYMAILDLRHATRPYRINEKKTQRDMSKTGEAREAKEYNLVKEDCIALNGFNSILVCPASNAGEAAKTGGIVAVFETVAALPSGEDLTSDAKKKVYVLSANDTDAGYEKGDVIQWDFDLDDWNYYSGTVRG